MVKKPLKESASLISHGLEACAWLVAPEDAELRHHDNTRRNSIIAACSRHAAGCSGRLTSTDNEQQRRVSELQKLTNPLLLAVCVTATRTAPPARCLGVNARDRESDRCGAYAKLPLDPLPANASTCSSPLVPKVYHATGPSGAPPGFVVANALTNPTYRLNYKNDSAGAAYVRERCGVDAAAAYDCLLPAAFRADIFRFCVLATEGGVYLDADLLLTVPLAETYAPCAVASVGHDYPQGPQRRAGAQMKLLAAAPRSRVFGCALRRVIHHVRVRYAPVHSEDSLMVSGPAMLLECINRHPRAVAFTYRDTHLAAWPHAGLTGRARMPPAADTGGAHSRHQHAPAERLLAFEVPKPHDFLEAGGTGGDAHHYSTLVASGQLYRPGCALHSSDQHTRRRRLVYRGRGSAVPVPRAEI